MTRKRCRDTARRDHVHQGVPVSELVEMHLANRHAMDTGLGLSEAAKDGGGLLSGAGLARGAGNALRKHGEGSAVMMIGIPGIRAIMMMVMSFILLWGTGKAEAAHDNPVALPFLEPRFVIWGRTAARSAMTRAVSSGRHRASRRRTCHLPRRPMRPGELNRPQPSWFSPLCATPADFYTVSQLGVSWFCPGVSLR